MEGIGHCCSSTLVGLQYHRFPQPQRALSGQRGLPWHPVPGIKYHSTKRAGGLHLTTHSRTAAWSHKLWAPRPHAHSAAPPILAGGRVGPKARYAYIRGLHHAVIKARAEPLHHTSTRHPRSPLSAPTEDWRTNFNIFFLLKLSLSKKVSFYY